MSIGEVKRYARNSLKGKWGFAILLMIITIAIERLIPTMISILIDDGAYFKKDNTLGTNIGNLISLFLAPITIGCSWAFLSIVRQEKVEISHLFQLFTDVKKYFKSIGLTLLVFIFTFLWALLLIIPGIIKSLAYSQVNFLYKDHPEYTITELITESRKLMDGYKWEYFLLCLSFIGWVIVSILTLGIGFIWLIPYINASLAEFYRQRVEDSKAEQIL
ncbi:DUF975 family protein [Bacillus sp. FJAT-49736]|uniref:DUF975 family protein n=1 Tax=Bacillus sp. FJAT-49736 TaxID=2833582 RepID=UPI001BCA1449|nr:DUF975 family protein [Bacillus sp. FJAT-49736]MBS4172768.1 DUF975 family protein [Bacillus sp. FJAT-49736]